MSPTDDFGNLFYNALGMARTMGTRLLSAYGALIILVPFIYQFVRCRTTTKAKEDLANRHL